jgi:sulfate transport system ATP-binding protein
MTGHGISLRNIRKCFGSHKALDDVSLDVKDGELMALLGPSGSGKTTLLRIIAGLEQADEGDIFLEGESSSGKHVRERGVGFVFQHYALFRNMNVFENVAFGMRVKKGRDRLDRQTIKKRVLELLEFVHLPQMQDRYPSQLSGGQRQRVALARTLAVEPKVLLLDEPFGALDAKVRKGLRRWLRELHDELGITTVFVTHDQEEALELADTIAVLDQGKIMQTGTPEEVWHHPTSAFVYDFFGNYNSFNGWVDPYGKYHITETNREVPGSMRPEILFARPHDTDILKIPEKNSISAKIININPAGPVITVELEDSHRKTYEVTLLHENFASLNLARGLRVYVRPRKLSMFGR